jgi:hypothetical protein
MTTPKIPVAVFTLGRVVATPNALGIMKEEEITTAIQRHQSGDWGDVSEEDRAANDQAMVQGTRILSAYHAENGTRFWILTEADRSRTTILLPEDY